MKNIVRKILSIFLLVSLVGVSSVFGYETDNNVLNNLQFEEKVLKYKNSLKNNLSSSEYKEFEEKFDKLSKDKKEDILDLLNNPNKLGDILSKNNYNDGNIRLRTETKIENRLNILSRSSNNLIITRAETTKILDSHGINFIKISSFVEYSHDMKTIHKIERTYSGVDRNWIPIVDFLFKDPYEHKGNKIVTYKIIVSYKLIYSGLPTTIATAEMGVKGSFYGKVYDWWKVR